MRNPECANNEMDEFYFEAYRFASQDSGQVYFHVTAQVCVEEAGTTSTCEQQCALCAGESWRRRQTIEHSVAAEYYIRAGPFIFADLKNDENGLSVYLLTYF